MIRRVPLHAPQIGPYLRAARIMYSLQLGSKRHSGGNNGRMQIRYDFTNRISTPLSNQRGPTQR